MPHKWLSITKGDLAIEREQCLDEGRDFTGVQKEYDTLLKTDLDNDPTLQPRAGAFLDATIALPVQKDYQFREPSDLAGIRAERPDGPRRINISLPDDVLFDNVLGAWLGRCAGCLLGKPVEGWRTERMWGYLKDLGRFPLADYFHSDIPEAVAKKYDVKGGAFINNVNRMVEDDDTNYTVTGFVLMKQKGAGFTPDDMADFWMQNIPLLHTCTAERVAYKNFSVGITAPASAAYRNVYREWIGAQIRADFFGYAAMGYPELAADFAFRDASISHVKNGIYGEMWVAAMLAAAPFERDVMNVIRTGLSEIPAKSRLARDIETVIGWHAEGIGYAEAISRIHTQWNEKNGHHWCHTNSNAMIVALGLLWGEGDFEKSVCRAVEACLDTDCNGATVGSVVGMMLGAKALPSKWIAPLNDTLDTGIAGYHRVSISAIAKEGFDVYRAVRERA
ncbi:MAG: ADP-ribosylglycohydrolase family protein [Spirochaetes bacterium]|nr:ADP-ribosylglycohydrolase family protein [Spirochaetota bacterium]